MRMMLEAFLITWAIMRMCAISSTHIMVLFLFGIASYVLDTMKQNTALQIRNLKSKRTIQVLSVLFVGFYTIGGREQLWSGLDNALFRMMILGVSMIGMYCLFYRVLQLVFYYANKASITKDTKEELFSNKLPLYSFFCCFLAWMPYFLKNFPGVMTIDSMNQYAQIIGVYAENNHHPWVHTKLIEFFYNIGMLFTKNPTISISFYTLFQMLFLSACVMYLVHVMRMLRVKAGVACAVTLFYAFMPYHGIYAVTIWKDPMFAGSVLLYVVSMFCLFQALRRNQSLKEIKGTIVIFLVSGIGMSLLRTNGYYAFLFALPFLIIGCQKIWRKYLFLMQLAMLAVVLFIKGPIMESREVIQPDFVESLSIPGQQISKVLMEGKPLSEEQSLLLNELLDTSKLPELYNPYVSDGFKRLIRAGNPQYLEDNLGQFLKIYLELGVRYPKEYWTAFWDQSIGYWFPEQEGLIAGDEGVIENEFGIQAMPLLKGQAVIKINEIILKLKDIIPVYGTLWNMGAITWIMLITVGLVYLKKDKSELLCFLPNIAILLTLLIATPVAKDFRYLYALIYCIPFYIVISLLETKQIEGDN